MIVLLVDDEVGVTRLFERILSDHTVHSFNDPLEALEFGRSNSFDLLLTDQKMPGMSGIDLVEELRKDSAEKDGDFTAIVVSAYTDSEDLINAVNSQAIYSYLVKPIHPNDLRQAVYQAQKHLHVKRERDRLQHELRVQNEELKRENRILKNSSSLESFISVHPATLKLKERMKMFALSESPVFICGETGTGKEIIARCIHELSPRREGPFVALNCSAFSPHLLDSELFGHAKGAYTGAHGAKKGLVETANGGTLFLDEIGEFPFEFQAKILRFIQFGTFIPVGATEEKQADTRIISATNKELSRKVEEGVFRQDLFYRLNTLTLSIPPLRERVVDIIPIMEEIAGRKGFHLPPLGAGTKKLIQSHPFWGNVREIEAFVEKLMLQNQQYFIEEISTDLVEELLVEEAYTFKEIASPQETGSPPFSSAVPDKVSDTGLTQMVREYEQQIIARVFEEKGRNISRTAEALKISRQGLKNKLKRYGIYAGSGLA